MQHQIINFGAFLALKCLVVCLTKIFSTELFQDFWKSYIPNFSQFGATLQE